MRILLVEPAKAPSTIGGEDVFLFEPLALEYVAAGVSEEHEVEILDLRLEKDLQGVLAQFRPDIVGITAYTVHVNVVRGLFEQVKKWRSDILTVVGGHHATVMPEDFLSPFIDLIVVGQGVFAFREIVRRFQKHETFQGIPGVSFAEGGVLAGTDPEPAGDLDLVPLPDRRLTARYRRHYYLDWMKPLASIRTSRGCPYRCTFCAEWKVAGGRYLTREPQKVVEELATIEEPCVFFADDESLVDVPRMKTLAGLIRQRGIRKRYFLYGRSDTITRHPDLLGLWRDIGLERVFVGLEFFRNEDLAYVRKRSTLEDNENAVRILRSLGIDVYASFIVRPEYTKSDFAALRQYCRHLGLNFASFAVLTPLPGTDLYQEVADKLITRNYDFFDFIHTLLPTALPREEFYAQYEHLFSHAIPLRKQLAQLRRYPWREIPHLLAKSRRVFKRIRTAHLDYATDERERLLAMAGEQA